MQMNNFASQFELVEANLHNLRARVPDLPVSGILLCRLLLHIGREMAVMFEQQIRPFGLAEAEFRVLTTLFSQPNGSRIPAICAFALAKSANMSRISDALVSRGLITRVSSLHDRRRMVLRNHGAGRAFVRQLLPSCLFPCARC